MEEVQSQLPVQQTQRLPLRSFILIGVLMLLIGIGVGYFSANTLDKRVSSQSPENKQLSSEGQISPTLSPSFQQTFKKRHYEANKFGDQMKKVEAILNSVGDEQLVDIQCSREYQYYKDDNDITYYDRDKEEMVNLTDPEIIGRIKPYMQSVLAMDKDAGAVTVQYCDTKSGKVVLQADAIGTIRENRPYFSTLSSAFEQPKWFQIQHIKGGIYYYCTTPLLLTTADELYFTCGQGEGGGGIEYYYAIDLPAQNAKLLAKCSYELAVVDEPIISCE